MVSHAEREAWYSDPKAAYQEAERRISAAAQDKDDNLDLRGLGALSDLPQAIADLKNLQALAVSSTKITDAGLAHLAKLTALKSLYLNDTRIKDAGLAHLAKLTGLQRLDLDSTRITGAGLAHLAKLTDLYWLNLKDTQITDARLAHLAKLTGLEILTLSGTPITDAGLAHLEGLTRLQTLDLDSTRITGAGLAHLAKLTALQWLNLEGTQITDASLLHLLGLTSLQVLYLEGTQIGDLRPLFALTQFQTGALELDDGIYFEDSVAAQTSPLKEIADIFAANPRMKALFEHLRSLPEWPLPMDGSEPEGDGIQKPAIRVVARAGKLEAEAFEPPRKKDAFIEFAETQVADALRSIRDHPAAPDALIDRATRLRETYWDNPLDNLLSTMAEVQNLTNLFESTTNDASRNWLNTELTVALGAIKDHGPVLFATDPTCMEYLQRPIPQLAKLNVIEESLARLVGSLEGIESALSEGLNAKLKDDSGSDISREIKRDIFHGFVRIGYALTAGIDPSLAALAPQMIEYLMCNSGQLIALMDSVSPLLGKWARDVFKKLLAKVLDKSLDQVSDAALKAVKEALSLDKDDPEE